MTELPRKTLQIVLSSLPPDEWDAALTSLRDFLDRLRAIPPPLPPFHGNRIGSFSCTSALLTPSRKSPEPPSFANEEEMRSFMNQQFAPETREGLLQHLG